MALIALFGLLILKLIPFAAPSDSIHDLLRSHGLPGGLFPKSVESFVFDGDTGLLEARLYGPCYAKYDGMAFFEQVVRGNLSHGELRAVVGLSQEELFLWLPVKEIKVSDPASGVILFDIGLAHKQMSLSLFEEPPDCRPEGAALLGFREGFQGIKERAFQGQR
ncbi:hypothetical protein J5N97_011694 [Dioscorea zingiberensis]|uniref:DUF538 family protein n=1 Tax=Dioscorea zingiberensis TaxID=325984 RepID=A0A9D5D2L7_9LILI|nr:hypothetical protein J5N97_011694 [Dioscorea zingiberensis]